MSRTYLLAAIVLATLAAGPTVTAADPPWLLARLGNKRFRQADGVAAGHDDQSTRQIRINPTTGKVRSNAAFRGD